MFFGRWFASSGSAYTFPRGTQVVMTRFPRSGELAQVTDPTSCYHFPDSPTWDDVKGWQHNNYAFQLLPGEEVMVTTTLLIPITRPYFDHERGMDIAGVWCFKRKKHGFCKLVDLEVEL